MNLDSNKPIAVVKKIGLIAVALLVCLTIVVAWKIFLEYRGITTSGLGGALPAMLLFFLLRGVWRKITGVQSSKTEK